MKSIFVSCLSVAALACSCSNSGQSQAASQNAGDSIQAQTAVVLDGQWQIENIVVNDTLNVRPSEETPDRISYITFDNGNYSIMTNCNSIQGSYTLTGDSITMNSGLCTEMACDNMRVEDMINKVLPEIRTVDMANDSTMRLNSAASEYIVLSRIKEPIK